MLVQHDFLMYLFSLTASCWQISVTKKIKSTYKIDVELAGDSFSFSQILFQCLHSLLHSFSFSRHKRVLFGILLRFLLFHFLGTLKSVQMFLDYLKIDPDPNKNDAVLISSLFESSMQVSFLFYACSESPLHLPEHSGS